MKLELKHLTGYLPYGLKIKVLNYKSDYVGIEYSEIDGYYYLADTLHFNYKGGGIRGKSLKEIKIYLKPLSDLSKEDLHIFSIDFRVMFKSKKKINIENYISLNDSEWLFENHFDIYGLIEKGLAISIHDVEQAVP
jgi:hypothetical protein